jgi:hypothetical protein
MKILQIICLISFLVGCASTHQPEQAKTPARNAEYINPGFIAQEIKDDKPKYKKEYLVSALNVVDICDKAINSPKNMIATVSSEAITAYQKMTVRYPEYNNSVLNSYLSRLINKISSLVANRNRVDIAGRGRYTPQEYNAALSSIDEIDVLLEEIQPLINGIKFGLQS